MYVDKNQIKSVNSFCDRYLRFDSYHFPFLSIHLSGCVCVFCQFRLEFLFSSSERYEYRQNRKKVRRGNEISMILSRCVYVCKIDVIAVTAATAVVAAFPCRNFWNRKIERVSKRYPQFCELIQNLCYFCLHLSFTTE